jgi:hypothetical protein
MPASYRLIKRRNLMAAYPSIAPQITLAFEKKNIESRELKLIALKQRIRSMLAEIFEGHEEFLGWTPN